MEFASEPLTPAKRPLIYALVDPRILFVPELLDPSMESLIYWRNTKRSAFVFVCGLGLLMMCSCLSIITILCFLVWLFWALAIGLRIYGRIFRVNYNAAPFNINLEMPPKKIEDSVGVAVEKLNVITTKMRDLLLIKDIGQSLKFGVLLIGLTYIGAWLNGVTLLVLLFIAIFTLPKIHEKRHEIDVHARLMCYKMAAKAKSNAPFPLIYYIFFLVFLFWFLYVIF